MRPYFAVIYDSFFEALKSRVLWILLAGWTVLLCAIAPFGWIEGADFQFTADSIINRDRLVTELVAAKGEGGSEAQKRVWSALDPAFQRELIRIGPNASPPVRMGVLANGLNAALDNAELYSVQAWPTASKRSEIADELKDSDPTQLNAARLAKLNRRLVELAFPACLRMSNGSSIWFGYGGLKIGNAIPVSRSGLQPFIEGGLLPLVLQIALGIVGIFVAIIVTSNLIPDMFAPGSMALLLSKPISRSGLLIAKFAGGIGFIVINVAYLLIGVYFLMGTRLQIWNTGILWCIPIFVFVFMIYYSVSMLAGLVWKNAIVSIVFVALFWAFCFVIGVTHEQMKAWAVELPQLTKLTAIDGQWLAASRRGQLQIWDGQSQAWQTIGNEGDMNRRILGPCWIEDKQLLVFGRPEWNPFMGVQSDRVRLQVSDFSADKVGSAKSNDDSQAIAPLWSEQRIDTLPELPSRTRRMKSINGRVLIVSELGLFELDIEAARNDRPQPTLFGMIPLPIFPKSETFRKMTPDDFVLQTPIDVAQIPDSEDIALLSGRRLIKLRRIIGEPADRYEVIGELTLEFPDSTLALIECNKQTCLVMTDHELAFSVDTLTWSLRSDVASLLKVQRPQEIEVDWSDGSFLILNGESRIVRASANADTADIVTGIRDATAIAMTDDNRLAICRKANRVDFLKSGSTSTSAGFSPKWSTLQWTYWTIVRPFYSVNPKPAALSEIIRGVLSTKSPFAFGRQTDELEEAEAPPDYWTPIWSNGLFIFVMLVISCFYLQRQDV